jgi:two-component SAPR family response regulator
MTKRHSNIIHVYTLGQFQVMRGDGLLSQFSGRSQSLWDLFKYLITYSEHGVPPEAAFETLWPEKQCTEPKRALRTSVYRLRKILESEENKGETNETVAFTHGCYRLNRSAFWLDTDEFQRLCQEAGRCQSTEPTRSIELYTEALAIYKGDYLAENVYTEWIIPVRNYYRRLYLQSALALIELLEKRSRYADIINICEKVFKIESLEEDFHIYFMDALIRERKLKQARSHYEYITSVLYRELDIKPSTAMTRLYKRTKSTQEFVDYDLSAIQDGFRQRREVQKTFYCEPDIFPYFYELERRKAERHGYSVYLGLITLQFAHLQEAKVKDLMLNLKDVLLDGLRKCDVCTQWSHTQFLLILPGTNIKNAERIMKRIRKKYNNYLSEKRGCFLDCQLQSVLQEKEYISC